MQILVHQTHHPMGDFHAVFKYLEATAHQESFLAKGQDPAGLPAKIHTFPLLLSQDHELESSYRQRQFHFDYEEAFEQLSTTLSKIETIFPQVFFAGGLKYNWDHHSSPVITSSLIIWEPGKPIKLIDQNEPYIYHFQNKTISLSMGETEILNQKKVVDLVIKFDAAPFCTYQIGQKLAQTKQQSLQLPCPIFYINKVALEDQRLFEGGSFAVLQGNLLFKCSEFTPEVYSHQLENTTALTESDNNINKQWEQTISGLQFALQTFIKATKRSKILVPLTGDINSALALWIISQCLTSDQELEPLYMPAKDSTSLAFDITKELCNHLKLKLRCLPIKFVHSSIQLALEDNLGGPSEDLNQTELQNHIRSLMAKTRAHQTHAVIIENFDKTQLALGSSVQYGAHPFSLAPLGDLYHSEVLELALFINKKRAVLPIRLLENVSSPKEKQQEKPSINQFTDGILMRIIEQNMGTDDLLKAGFNADNVKLVEELYHASEYKHCQVSSIVKLKNKRSLPESLIPM